VLQLLLDRDTTAARLPAAYRGWASLPEMTDVAVYAEPRWVDWLTARGAPAVLDVRPMSHAAMREDWQSCRRVMVL
jgi:hypothetical protein